MFLALQGLLDFLSNPASSWILVPTLALLIPVVAIVMEPIKQRMKQAERREARQAYERLAREKLDIIKGAIAMGYNQQDLAALDARLERLIGADKLQQVLDPKAAPKLDAALAAQDYNDFDPLAASAREKVSG